jgi:DNA-directed RNA polymerase subunit alpha
VNIKGATHEFSGIPHVKEDVVELILNLKNLRLRMDGEEPTTITLAAKGEKSVKAKDLEVPSGIDVVDPNHHLATLTDKAAELELELTVTHGRGYVPVEMRGEEKLPLGTIAIDAIYTPIRNVNYRVENLRVGQMTNYDRLLLTIRTDGTVTPEEAFSQASDILLEHLNVLKSSIPKTSEQRTKRSKKSASESAEAGETKAQKDAKEEKKPRKDRPA